MGVDVGVLLVFYFVGFFFNVLYKLNYLVLMEILN